MFLFLFLNVKNGNAQMMGGATVSQSDQQSTQQDEAAGKAIWDKLQNKQVACKDLKDNDFDVLGDFFMGSMMGSSHAYMNQLMTQRLGENREKQMHIVMGKRLSGCDTNATFPQGSGYFMPMMGWGGMMGGNWNQPWGGSGKGMMGFGNWNNMMGNGWGILSGVTWVLIVIFLVLGIIYFLKGINRSDK